MRGPRFYTNAYNEYTLARATLSKIRNNVHLIVFAQTLIVNSIKLPLITCEWQKPSAFPWVVKPSAVTPRKPQISKVVKSNLAKTIQKVQPAVNGLWLNGSVLFETPAQRF
jgi:hypothetical protein